MRCITLYALLTYVFACLYTYWWRRTGRPRQTWLRTIEDDLRPLNFGLATARRRALDRQTDMVW